MRYALVLLLLLTAFSLSPQNARAIDSARDLVNSCRSLEKGKKGAGQDIQIPYSKDALLCWGYMRAMQDFSVLVDENGRRFIGSCPPEETTLLELIRSFMTYARSHPGELKGNAALMVIKALHETFPCPLEK